MVLPSIAIRLPWSQKLLVRLYRVRSSKLSCSDRRLRCYVFVSESMVRAVMLPAPPAWTNKKRATFDSSAVWTVDRRNGVLASARLFQTRLSMATTPSLLHQTASRQSRVGRAGAGYSFAELWRESDCSTSFPSLRWCLSCPVS